MEREVRGAEADGARGRAEQQRGQPEAEAEEGRREDGVAAARLGPRTEAMILEGEETH